MPLPSPKDTTKAQKRALLKAFNRQVECESGHWRWVGPTVHKRPTQPRFCKMVGNQKVDTTARRFAMRWLLERPVSDQIVTFTCEETLCVRPTHLAVVADKAEAWKVRVGVGEGAASR